MPELQYQECLNIWWRQAQAAASAVTDREQEARCQVGTGWKLLQFDFGVGERSNALERSIRKYHFD